jgi:hypothetical protein
VNWLNDQLHWTLALIWIAYPAMIVFCAILRRQLDQVAPADFKRKGK